MTKSQRVFPNQPYKTSTDDGHFHLWRRDRQFTSTDDGHRHRVNLEEMMAESADGHTHRLTTTKG